MLICRTTRGLSLGFVKPEPLLGLEIAFEIEVEEKLLSSNSGLIDPRRCWKTAEAPRLMPTAMSGVLNGGKDE